MRIGSALGLNQSRIYNEELMGVSVHLQDVDVAKDTEHAITGIYIIYIAFVYIFVK